uniref:Uncharacterized protein n=1 Tax=Brassica oleracea var. oleracea TaxID=109376 RepID=A0A0D3CGC1_BRAOL
MRRNGKSRIQTLVFGFRLGFLANHTSATDPFHILHQTRPIKVLIHNLVHFLDSKVSHKASSMSFPEKQLPQRTLRHTQTVIKE